MSDTLTWPDGTVYTITRSSPEELEMKWRLHAGGWAHNRTCTRRSPRSTRSSKPYIRALCRTANARRLGDLRAPRSLLYIALLVERYPNHSRAAGPLLDAAAPRLASVARRLHLTTA